MAPIDLGGVGDVVDKATGAVGGGVLDKATEAVVGAATTAMDKASGAVSTATSAVGDVKNQADEAAGMLAMFKKIQGYIDTLEQYWDQYKNLIIFIVCLIIFIYVASLIYCCYHFCHDFCRCAGCYLKCTWRTEEFIRKRGWRCARYCCRTCCGVSRSPPGRDGESKKDYHKCSNCCLYLVPRSTRIDLEKQHGDLRKGWTDTTYLGRACGRYPLDDDPVKRAKWHWWGHEDWPRAKYMMWLFPWGLDKQERIDKEVERQQSKYRFFDKLNEHELRDRADISWAAKHGYLKKVFKKTKEEKKMVARAQQKLEEKEAQGRTSTDSESTAVGDYAENEKRVKGKE